MREYSLRIKPCFVFTFIFMVYLIPQNLMAKETIQWLWFEQAPYFVGKNPRVGTGVVDELTRYFQEQLPDYEHQNVRVNTVRYDSMIKKDNVCVPVAWLSENEKQYLVHSRPHALEPPAGIYIHQSKQQEFGPRNSVLSLRALLADKSLTLGALRGMEYSNEADLLLAEYHERKNLMMIDAPMIEIDLHLLKMGRLDYLLGLPVQAKRIKSDEYLFYNVQEISAYVPMYAHCSNTPFGKKVIKVIDGLLTKQRLVKSIDYYERWYDGSDDFRSIFLDYIVHEGEHPFVADM